MYRREEHVWFGLYFLEKEQTKRKRRKRLRTTESRAKPLFLTTIKRMCCASMDAGQVALRENETPLPVKAIITKQEEVTVWKEIKAGA